MVGYLRRSLVD